MDSFKAVLRCAFPRLHRLQANRQEDQERVARMERRREKFRQLCLLKLSMGYNIGKEIIDSEIEFDYIGTIVVWIQEGRNIFRSHVVQELSSYGEIVFFQDRYTLNEEGYRIWHGAVVSYKKWRQAQMAFLYLPQKIRYVKTTMLKALIETLIACELLHPDRAKYESSKVVISRSVPLRFGEVGYLHRTLNKYGSLQTLFFNNRQNDNSESHCEATYPYLAQAYLAMIMTDGHAGDSAVYTSSIERTPRDKQILEDAEETISLLYKCCFPK